MRYWTALDAATGTTPSDWVPTGGCRSVVVFVKSATTSTSTVYIELSVDGGTTLKRIATITNVSSAGEVWIGPALENIRINPSSVGAGAITAVVATSDIPTDYWHQLDASTVASAFGAIALGADVSGQLPVANGGTGQATATAGFDALAPTTTRGDLIFRNATVNARLAKGTEGYYLRQGANDPAWAALGLADASGVLAVANGGTAAATGMVVEAAAADGAIAIARKHVFATKAGVAAMTLTTPTVTTHDGIEVTFTAATDNAHTLTTPAGKINGDSAVVTLGGAAGDSVTLVAYQGIWYTKALINATLS